MKNHIFVLFLLLSRIVALSFSSEDLAFSFVLLLLFGPSLLSALPFAEEKEGGTGLSKLDDSAKLEETHQLQRQVSGIHTVDNAGEKVDEQTTMRNYDPSVPLEMAEKSGVRGKQNKINKQEQEQKPHLVIHIGPAKTSSTYLQSVLRNLNENHVLGKDGYVYYNARSYCTINQRQCCNYRSKCPFSSRFTNVINESFAKRKNLIISSEFLARYEGDKMKKEIDAVSQFDAQVIFMYRRNHEILVSLYHEHMKHPRESGQGLVSFVQWHSKFWRSWFTGKRRNLEMYGDTFPVYVVPIYVKEGEELATIFVCKFVPETQASCKALENGVPKTWLLNTNPSRHIDYSRLALAAYGRGYLQGGGKSDDKGNVTSQKQPEQKANYKLTLLADSETIRMYVEETKNWTLRDLPQECLSYEQIEEVYSKSWEMEQFLLGTFPTRMLEKYGGLGNSSTTNNGNNTVFDVSTTFLRRQQWALSQYAPMNEATFRQVFETYRDGKNFCSVDVEKVLDDAEWIQFFLSH